MYESFRDDKRHSKGSKQTPVLLLLEELESRCLLSTGLQVSNQLLTSAPVAEREAGAMSSIGVVRSGVQEADGTPVAPLDPGSTIPSQGTVWISSVSVGANGGICVGPDGSVWLQEYGQVGQLNPTTGVIRQFNLPPGTDWEGNIIIGPDGNLWLPR